MYSEVFLLVTRKPANNPLVQARQSKGLRQSDVALAVGISRTGYTHIERGTKRPSLDVAMKLANFFNQPVETLFGEERDTQ